MRRDQSAFENRLGGDRDGNLVGDFVAFLRDSKKWWLLPVVVLLLLFGLLMVLSGTAAAPFIYTLF